MELVILSAVPADVALIPVMDAPLIGLLLENSLFLDDFEDLSRESRDDDDDDEPSLSLLELDVLFIFLLCLSFSL